MTTTKTTAPEGAAGSARDPRDDATRVMPAIKEGGRSLGGDRGATGTDDTPILAQHGPIGNTICVCGATLQLVGGSLVCPVHAHQARQRQQARIAAGARGAK